MVLFIYLNLKIIEGWLSFTMVSSGEKQKSLSILSVSNVAINKKRAKYVQQKYTYFTFNFS